MESDLLTYLDNYGDLTFDRVHFNEVDALILACLAYPKYNEIVGDTEICEGDNLLRLLERYDDSSLTERKKLNITLLIRVCSLPRYYGIKIIHYRHSLNKDICEQFQAVSFLFNDYMIVSFCGTDNTVVGLKEDLNMSYLEITPSEIDAVNYLKEITSLYPDKQLILVGHSKGGRLAVSSAKSISDKTCIRDIYTFDSPNYPNEFYDNEYKKIEKKIHNYVPEDSIVGRLINEPKNPIIVKSHNSLIQQHDLSSWIIIDNHLLTSIEGYSKQSTRISKALNHNLEHYDYGTKKAFTDTLFGLIDRLDIHEFKGKSENLSMLKGTLKQLPQEWKSTPKSDRSVLKKLLFEMIKAYLFGTEK